MKTKTHIYLNENELAAIFGVTPTTIWGWIRMGKFPLPIKVAGGCIRWRVDEINAWEEEIAADPNRRQPRSQRVAAEAEERRKARYGKLKGAVIKQKTQQLEEVT